MEMHSKQNLDYTIHYNGDFSKVIYIDKQKNEIEIPPAVIGLLYSAIGEDIAGKVSDTINDAVWEQSKIGLKCELYYYKEER